MHVAGVNTDSSCYTGRSAKRRDANSVSKALVDNRSPRLGRCSLQSLRREGGWNAMAEEAGGGDRGDGKVEAAWRWRREAAAG